LLLHFLGVLLVQRGQLGAFTCIEELASHARLSNRDTHAALQFSASIAVLEVLLLGDDYLLRAVVGSSAFALVLGLLLCGELVAFIQILDDCGIQLLHFLFEWL
jgi:hypothetical protein